MIDGVVRAPSAFSITLVELPSMMATHELVVPKSIPMILPILMLRNWLKVQMFCKWGMGKTFQVPTRQKRFCDVCVLVLLAERIPVGDELQGVCRVHRLRVGPRKNWRYLGAVTVTKAGRSTRSAME
jgi:hypothetical protein